MTAVATTDVRTEPSAFARVWRIVRLITANPATTVVWPLVILAAIFAGTWTIWWLIISNLDETASGNAQEGITYNGASTYIFVYMLVVAVQAVNYAFPLALGFGATRRSFTAGSALTFVILSGGYASVMLIGALIEAATNGWGLGTNFFRTAYFEADAGWVAQWWIYFCWFVFFFFVGMIFAAVFVRWRAVGLTAAFLTLGVAAVGAVAIFTFTASWHLFWDALVGLGTMGMANMLLLVGVVSAFASHLILRRATPRS